MVLNFTFALSTFCSVQLFSVHDLVNQQATMWLTLRKKNIVVYSHFQNIINM